ncbi:MAG TPA: QueT transporter family protein [Syntrophorhabdaceae bacterium]|mgnify:CR=1 FL=1|nr:QueT transporter family protein [Syntrophorhabdaceae bacterium]HPP06438.1 QueT transporter family protein [Syntrophorhabdaceae bacterium]
MIYAIKMWNNTRMIVLVAVVAAIYAATLIAFKTAIPLIPGITEVRIANIFPMTFGFLFGPAGAWGLAIGNFIGDIFGGTFGPASIAGFFGNFLLGFLPYTMWTVFIPFCEKKYKWERKSFKSWCTYISINLISSMACSIIIGVAVDALGMAPFEVISKIITINNFIGGLIGIIFLMLVYDVTTKQMGLFWIDIMDVDIQKSSKKGMLGSWIVAVGSITGILGVFITGITLFNVKWLSTVLIIIGSILL